jgi:predicted DsbA family dithiol-disulfide isomerase
LPQICRALVFDLRARGESFALDLRRGGEKRRRLEKPMTDGSSPTPLTIDIVSDTVCPWCYVGKRKLEAALAVKADVPVEVRWRPYQLDPTIPPGGIPRADYMEKKFGGAERVAEIHRRIESVGREADIPFAFDKIARSPNTLDAHRLIRWAASAGKQDAVVEHLFKAFFEEGENIGDPAVLARIAGECGMDAALVSELLAGEADKDAVREEIAMAQKLGVNGVPFFIIGGRFAVSGAQSPEVLASAIDSALKPEGATAAVA